MSIETQELAGAVHEVPPPVAMMGLITGYWVSQAVGVVALTVLLSVVLHGVSAGPLGSRYVRVEEQATEAAPPRARRLVHRRTDVS